MKCGIFEFFAQFIAAVDIFQGDAFEEGEAFCSMRWKISEMESVPVKSGSGRVLNLGRGGALAFWRAGF